MLFLQPLESQRVQSLNPKTLRPIGSPDMHYFYNYLNNNPSLMGSFFKEFVATNVF